MKKTLACLTLLITATFLQAQETSAGALTKEEETAVAAILAKQAQRDEQAKTETAAAEKITLPEENKQQARDENTQDGAEEPDET